MTASVLVINAGSSSVKFQLFAAASPDRIELITKGQMDGIGTRPRLQAKDAEGRILVDQKWSANDVGSVQGALDRSIPFLREQVGGKLPAAVGHRVVHGGPHYDAPVLVDDAVLKRLESWHLWRRSTSSTTWLRSRPFKASIRSSRRSPASIPPFIEGIRT